MGKVLFTADTHFGDERQLILQKRPFSSVEEMDEVLIDNWNKETNKWDDIWIIGDLISHSKHDYTYYLKRLKGQKHLIIGNHDYNLVRDKKALSYFVSVDNYKTTRVNGELVVMNHYPLAEWNGFFKGVHHVHGHIHTTELDTPAARFMGTLERAYNAGCVFNGFKPVIFEELINNNLQYKI